MVPIMFIFWLVFLDSREGVDLIMNSSRIPERYMIIVSIVNFTVFILFYLWFSKIAKIKNDLFMKKILLYTMIIASVLFLVKIAGQVKKYNQEVMEEKEELVVKEQNRYEVKKLQEIVDKEINERNLKQSEIGDTSDWVLSNQFNFKLKHPKDWTSYNQGDMYFYTSPEGYKIGIRNDRGENDAERLDLYFSDANSWEEGDYTRYKTNNIDFYKEVNVRQYGSYPPVVYIEYSAKMPNGAIIIASSSEENPAELDKNIKILLSEMTFSEN